MKRPLGGVCHHRARAVMEKMVRKITLLEEGPWKKHIEAEPRTWHIMPSRPIGRKFTRFDRAFPPQTEVGHAPGQVIWSTRYFDPHGVSALRSPPLHPSQRESIWINVYLDHRNWGRPRQTTQPFLLVGFHQTGHPDRRVLVQVHPLLFNATCFTPSPSEAFRSPHRSEHGEHGSLIDKRLVSMSEGFSSIPRCAWIDSHSQTLLRASPGLLPSGPIAVLRFGAKDLHVLHICSWFRPKLNGSDRKEDHGRTYSLQRPLKERLTWSSSVKSLVKPWLKKMKETMDHTVFPGPNAWWVKGVGAWLRPESWEVKRLGLKMQQTTVS